MPIQLTPDFVRTAINTRHPNAAICEKFARKLDVHAKGEVPEKLIDDRRPSESEAVKDYRKKIYVPITKEAVGKVINSLSKIRRSQDWSIRYKSDDVPKQIKSDETLEYYCEYDYPGFTSLTNWAFSELLKRSLIDANSVCAVILKSLPTDPADYLRPEAEIFGSGQILSYVPGQYYALLSADVCTYQAGNNRVYEGKIYYIVTDAQIARYEERAGKGLVQTLIYNHNFGELPVFKVGGVYFDRKNNDVIMESRIASMVPFLDEAAREYSDLQAEIVQHIHSEKVIYTNDECPVCNGAGIARERDENGNFKTCSKCNGKGNIKSVSPYGEYLISMGKAGVDAQVPNPAVVYVNKDTAIAVLQADRINHHIYKALSSINMEFLAQTPLNQSGTAKEVDRDELDNFVNSVAEDIVAVLDNVYYFICRYRYSLIVPDSQKLEAMLPVVPVPERFGLLNSSILMQEIQTARTAGCNPIILKNLETEFLRKKYNAEPGIACELETVFDLDPFYGYGQQEKMTMLNNGGITETDYVISCNIVQFVRRAFEEDGDFHRKPFARKKEIVAGYAAEVTKENSAKESIKEGVFAQINPDDGEGAE